METGFAISNPSDGIIIHQRSTIASLSGRHGCRWRGPSQFARLLPLGEVLHATQARIQRIASLRFWARILEYYSFSGVVLLEAWQVPPQDVAMVRFPKHLSPCDCHFFFAPCLASMTAIIARA